MRVGLMVAMLLVSVIGYGQSIIGNWANTAYEDTMVKKATLSFKENNMFGIVMTLDNSLDIQENVIVDIRVELRATGNYYVNGASVKINLNDNSFEYTKNVSVRGVDKETENAIRQSLMGEVDKFASELTSSLLNALETPSDYSIKNNVLMIYDDEWRRQRY